MAVKLILSVQCQIRSQEKSIFKKPMKSFRKIVFKKMLSRIFFEEHNVLNIFQENHLKDLTKTKISSYRMFQLHVQYARL